MFQHWYLIWPELTLAECYITGRIITVQNPFLQPMFYPFFDECTVISILKREHALLTISEELYRHGLDVLL
jgi:hypothetical protein